MEAALKAIILGLVQGLTEFLPVSSKSHLIFAKDLLRLPEPGIHWAICLHLATVVSTVAVFRREILDLLRGFGKGASITVRTGSLTEAMLREERFRLALLYIISAIPVGLAALFFKKPLERLFDDALLAGAVLGVTGAILWLTRCKKDPESGKPVGLRGAIVMGLAQAVALVPGISRSGVTISSGIFAGMKPSEAARFSFLMAVPPILGAALLDAKEIRHATLQSSGGFASIAIGFVVAAVVGYFALRWLLPVIRRGNLYRFAYYCWAMGAAVMIWKGAQLLAGK